MTILANGANVTLSVAAGQILTVVSNQAEYVFENPVGTRIGDYASNCVFGPFTSPGSVKITSVQGSVWYELASGPVRGVVPGVASVVAQSAVPASVTGTLSETTLATIAIPAGAMGANGMLRITALWSFTNSANNKTLKGVLAASQFMNQVFTTSTSIRTQTMITNRGAANSQVGHAASAGAFSGSTSAVVTSAVDTTQAQNFTLTGTLANTGETITLEGYTVEILNP